MASTEQRLFAPGDGAAPPELAGRSTQQAVLSRCLADLVGGSAPPHNVVLVGPRGNGKTVLLNWFKTACVDAPSVEVLALTPRDIPTPPALVGALLPRRGLTKLMSRLPRKVGIASVGSVEWTPTDGSGWRNLAEELAARCRRKPLVFLLDEAHTLEPNVGSALLNASQQVRAEAPLLLVLAGTPGLPAHLNAMDTSFWGRLGEGLLGVGRLSDAAARAALSKPLTRHDVEIDADALDAVIEDSQHYPYFIQLWGDALWQWHLANAGARLTTAATAAVQDAVAARVANYYEGRYQELAAGGLLSAATAVAPLFQGAMDATASNQEVDNALLAAALEDSAERFAASEGLNRLSYMWRPPGQLPPVLWSIGIPSLTTYVLEHAPASAIGGVPTREKTPKPDNKELDERRGIGPQSTGDDVFQRRMRRHQSWYRDKVLKVPYGTGPTKSRTSLYGNMLTKESAEAGLNFLSPEIFEVAKTRLGKQRTKDVSGVEEFRLLRNMLTSQTMCFNLFGELASDHQLAARLAQALWGNRIASVLDLRIEWAPQPACEYLNDKTAFDAFLEYKTAAGDVGFVGVETKLTEPFSEKDYDRPEYRRWMKQPCPWKKNAGDEVAARAHNQLWRDHLLAWSLLRHPNSKYAEGRFAVVYHPEDIRCKRTIHRYRGLLNDTDATFCDFDLAEIVSAWEPLAGEWLSKFHQRYLALEESEEGVECQA